MVYIDKSSMEKLSQSSKISAWVWTIFRNDQASEFGNYRSDKHRLTIDCEKQEAGVDTGSLYSAYGKLIQQYRRPAPEMAPIGPATLRETIAKFFCTGGKQPARTLPVYDPNRDAEQRFLLREREGKPAETASRPTKG